MASLLEHSKDKRNPREAVAQSLRKVTSMTALRGRSSLPRCRHHDSSSSAVASKFSRAASLGRYRVRHAPSKEQTLDSDVQDYVECGYPQKPAAPQLDNLDETSETRVWAVGRISMIFLLVVTFTDVAFKVVDNHMSQIESHDYYDALSPDVIRPAFLYKVSNIGIEKPTLGLGSAAISSITDALGPILPFTGGVDLRREEYYASGNIFENLQALVQQTYQAYANARPKEPSLTADASNGRETKRKQSSKKGKTKHSLTLGASDPFVSLDKVAELTLKDVGDIFDYVTRSTKEGFNPKKFQDGARPRVKVVLQAMENAVAKSRGKGVEVAKLTTKEPTFGKTDAFLFCAAMRVFAEWRILRQVPEGYKGYAVGMSLGQKDVVQNVAKMERAAQAWIDEQIEFEERASSPTLRDILQYEIDIGDHPTLPRLQETSGAMGLLWVRRQLHYQTVIFQNILEVPDKYPTSKDAVSAAYTEVYGQYHGWAVQKIFTYSFQASPKIEEIMKFMNPHKLEEVLEMARSMDSDSSDDSSEDEALSEPDRFAEGQEPENIFHRIGWEVEKFFDGVARNLNKKKVRGSGQQGDGLSGGELEEFVCAEMSKNVHAHIVSYLDVVKPLLDDLGGLFDELNMDDPTKV